MSEENKEQQPPSQEPVDAEIVPTEQPQKFGARGPASKLSQAPKEILEELDQRILEGEPILNIRNDMLQKYPTVEELKAGYLSWTKRAKYLRGSTKDMKEGSLVKKELVSSLPTTEDLKSVVSKVIDPEISLNDKQTALSALFDKATGRLKLLESRQQQFLSPELEALMLSYMKEQRALIEKVTELQEVLNHDVLKQMRGELDEYTRVLLSTVYASYKSVHNDSSADSKFDAFRTNLEDLLAKTLASYHTHQNTSKN